jgi:hypothetical protein
MIRAAAQAVPDDAPFWDKVQWNAVLQAAIDLLPDSERVKELEAEVAKWQKLAGENFHHSADIEKERFTLSAKLDRAEAREQALIVANGKAEEERIAAEEALAESHGREAMLVEAAKSVISYDHHGRLIAAKDGDGDRTQNVIFAGEVEELDRLYDVMLTANQKALTSTQPEAEAHNARIRREALEEAAKLADERLNADSATAYDKRQCGLPDHHWCGGASASEAIATAIRSLMDEEKV